MHKRHECTYDAVLVLTTDGAITVSLLLHAECGGVVEGKRNFPKKELERETYTRLW